MGRGSDTVGWQLVQRIPLLLDGTSLQTSDGRVAVWNPCAGLLLARLNGHGHKAFVDPIVEAFDRALSVKGAVTLFFDAEELETYDSALRLQLTKALQAERARIGGLHVLVRSRLVAMGVRVANLALGGIITSYVERDSFLGALETALATAGAGTFPYRELLLPARAR